MSSRNSKAFKFPGLETSHASLVVAGDEDDVTVDDGLSFALFIFFFFVVVIFRRVGTTTGQRLTAAARKDMRSRKRKEMKKTLRRSFSPNELAVELEFENSYLLHSADHLDDDDDFDDDFDDEKETSSPRMSPREKNNASPSRLRKRLRGILDDNFASENFRRGGLEKIASVLEDNARLRSEKSALERDLKLYKKKDKENEREIRALRAISEDDERYSRMEKRLRLFEKHFGRVVEKLSARDEEERRNALMRTMLQRWKASAKARRMGKRENTMTSTGSNRVVVSRGREEEKIEQLEDENADLRGALYTVKKKLRRTRLIFLQYDRLLAGGTIESDSDSDYSDSEY